MDSSHSKLWTPKTVVSDLSGPKGEAMDAIGNIYIADTGNNRVLKLSRQASSGQTNANRLRSGSTFSHP